MTPEWIVPGVKWERVGSRVTCNPAPTDTDEDFLVYDKFFLQTSALRISGFALESYGHLDSKFKSYRKGNTNVILTTNKEFYTEFLFATSVAKKLNLLEKKDRVTLFEAIMSRTVEESIPC